MALLAGNSYANIFTVNDAADLPDFSTADNLCSTVNGTCTLRAALEQANALPAGPHFINFIGGLPPIVLGGSQLVVANDITINGNGPANTIIGANFNSRVFQVVGGNVTINGVLIQEGTDAASGGTTGGGIDLVAGILNLQSSQVSSSNAKNGGGIATAAGTTLVVTDSTISSNQALNGTGGGLAISGAATLVRSAVINNLASPGASKGGGISVSGSLTATNVTISSNFASAGAGAIHATGTGIVHLKFVTVSDNDNANAGQLFRTAGSTFDLQNTIVASPIGANSFDCDPAGAMPVSLGHNLDAVPDCGFAAAGDLNGFFPVLGGLQNNGGQTPTRALGQSSPALDAGIAIAGITEDQRGNVVRPQGGGIDIGAFEADAVGPTITNGPPGGTVGVAYNFTFTATGAPSPTFSVPPGSLPPGLNLSAAGVISGTPTAAGTFNAIISATNAFSIDSVNPPITIAPGLAATTTTVTPPPAATTFGQAAVFQATVTGAAPSGTVDFADNGTPMCTGKPVVQGGGATCTISTLSAGVHPIITAHYNGDANNGASTSLNGTHTVNPAATTTTLTAAPAGQSTLNNLVTFTATVAGPAPFGGTVDFADAGNAMCSAVPVDAVTGKADCAFDTLPAGQHNALSATYTPDGNHLGSSMPNFAYTINPGASVTTVTANINPSNFNQLVTFTATVAGATPTGAVTFRDGPTAIAGCAGVNLVAGSVTCPISTLTPGAHPITVAYVGDASNGPSTSGVLTQNVQSAPAFTIPAPPAQLSATVGVPFSRHYTASGFPAPQFTGAGLPAWLTLDPVTGWLTGTPPAPGTVIANITATNLVGAVSQGLSIGINAAPAALTITSTPPGDGIVGIDYSQPISAPGTPPGTFSVSDGALPPGLALLGNVIAGTPTTVGTYTGTFTASNGVNPDGKQAFNISIFPLHQGIWWGGQLQNGWGLSVFERDGANLVSGWYYFGSDGKPAWLIMPGCAWSQIDADKSKCQGDVYTSTGAWFGNYDAAAFEQAKAGSLAFTFNKQSPNVATLDYEVNDAKGQKQLTRFDFTEGTTPGTANYTDLWWAGQGQNGWGVTLYQQGKNLAGAWYTYDTKGHASWFVIHGGGWTNESTYVGELQRATGAPVLGMPYDPAQFLWSDVGQVTLKFADDKNGTMTYQVDGITQTKTISRFAF